jgi:1-acyl-sn-glycerol-3-phosphate acyltransferase
MKILAKIILWLTGWQVAGAIPPERKFVVILAPHTSGSDFIYAMCARFVFDVRFSFLAKEELFRPPFGFIFRRLGGIAIDRSAKHNFVEQAVSIFSSKDDFILALSPEGTREYVPKWKTGFYYIALYAKVPVVLAYLNFEKKVVGIGPTFYPTGNCEKDIETIKDFYRPIKGKYPDKGVR